MNSRIFLISLILTLFILIWGSFVYLSFGLIPNPNYVGGFSLQGWNHGFITGVVFPLILITVFSVAFISRSFFSALLVYVVSVVLVFSVSGVGLLLYRSEGCPRPYTLKSLEARKAKFSDPQKFLADWKERYRKSNPTDTWEPSYADFEKERTRLEKDFALYNRKCSAFDTYDSDSLISSRLTVENPETYLAFIGSLAGDLRMLFYSGMFIIWIVPLAFVGKLLGRWILK